MLTLEDGSEVDLIPDNYTGSLTSEYGTKAWYHNGKFHRIDGPAVIFYDGAKYWHKHGKRHRIDGPAMLLDMGENRWYFNDMLHRTNGPAIENKGIKDYFICNVKIHKLSKVLLLLLLLPLTVEDD
jgi:hypothetical protein